MPKLPKSMFRIATNISLLIAFVFLAQGPQSHFGPAPVQARTRTQDGVQPSDTSTVYLPIVTNWSNPSYISPFGYISYGSVDDAAGRQKMADAGSRRVTTSLSWAAIEPTQGTYNWSSFDVKAQNAQAAGLEMFVLFNGNPSWAAQYPGGPVYNIQYLVNFVTLMAERYDGDGIDDAPGSPCVHYWSFYAEPDNGSTSYASRGWGYWGNNGAGYAEMLYRISPVIHAANPKSKVSIGGLAYDWFTEEGGPFVRAFLGNTLAALNSYPGGAKTYLDAVAFHFYPISAGRWPTIREKALEVRGIMNQHGAGNLLLLCPEAGYWSSPKFGSSEEGQANRLVQMYVRSLSVNISFLSWYEVFDRAIAGSADDLYPDRTSGLLYMDGSHKPSYHAYRTLASELDLSYYKRTLNVANVEGYVFLVPGNREKTVLWATNSSTLVPFGGSCLRLVNRSGYDSMVQDGQAQDMDGQVNGQISLRVYQNTPVYVELCH